MSGRTTACRAPFNRPMQKGRPVDALTFSFQRNPPWLLNISVYYSTEVFISISMNSKELEKLLKKAGCTFENHKGGSGHKTVRRGDRTSQLPMHGSRQELGTRIVRKILKDLGIE